VHLSGTCSRIKATFFYITGYGKTVSHVIIGLKTAKGTKQLKLDPSIYESLQREKVEGGDVIYIEANSGAVKRQGRSDTFATEYDLEVRLMEIQAFDLAYKSITLLKLPLGGRICATSKRRCS